MNVEQLRTFAIGLAGVEEGFPFGEDTLVFKAGGKIFMLLSLDAFPPSFNVKCDPEKAIDLRARYSSIQPGYHMNKKHWNTVIVDNNVPEKLILQMIRDSYELVTAKSKKR